MLRRVQVQADNIGRFRGKLRVGADAARAMPAQLNAVVAQHAPHRIVRDTQGRGQRTAIPTGQPLAAIPVAAGCAGAVRLRIWASCPAAPDRAARRCHQRQTACATSRPCWAARQARATPRHCACPPGKREQFWHARQGGFRGAAAGKVHQFSSLFGRTRQCHRDPRHKTPELVCEPQVSYEISHINAIKH